MIYKTRNHSKGIHMRTKLVIYNKDVAYSLLTYANMLTTKMCDSCLAIKASTVFYIAYNRSPKLSK